MAEWKSRKRLRWPSQPVLMAIFLVVGATTRLSLRHTESRWQIMALLGAACLVEIARPRDRGRLRVFSVMLLWASAAAGVLIVKAVLEPNVDLAAAKVVRKEVRRGEREIDRR